ncbi:MAG: hypothetical protein V1778_01935 [bacterium]
MPKHVFLVTPGSIFGPEGDPTHYPADIAILMDLRGLLPEKPTQVLCGVGRRFLEIPRVWQMPIDILAKALGTADLPYYRDGQWLVRLPGGSVVTMDSLPRFDDLLPEANRLVVEAPEGSVIIAGRTYAEAMFGSRCPAGPMVLRLMINNGQITGNELLNPRG